MVPLATWTRTWDLTTTVVVVEPWGLPGVGTVVVGAPATGLPGFVERSIKNAPAMNATRMISTTPIDGW